MSKVTQIQLLLVICLQNENKMLLKEDRNSTWRFHPFKPVQETERARVLGFLEYPFKQNLRQSVVDRECLPCLHNVHASASFGPTLVQR
jgi:hypothetical protein